MGDGGMEDGVEFEKRTKFSRQFVHDMKACWDVLFGSALLAS